MACRKQLLDCMKKTATKPFDARRGCRGAVRQNAGGSQRQMWDQGFLGAGRRIGGIAGNSGGQRCRGNILGCIPEECSAQAGSLLRAERRAKTRFGLPRAGGFRHDADRATCCRAWCLAFRPARSAVRRRSHDASFHSPIKRVQPWLDISQRGIVKPSREFFFLPAINKVTGGEEQNVSARVRRGRSW